MIFGLGSVDIKIQNLIYSQSATVGSIYTFSEEPKKEEDPVDYTEYDVLNILAKESYDPALTVTTIVERFGLSFIEASSVLQKYREQHEALTQMKINQNPPQGDTITYIS